MSDAKFMLDTDTVSFVLRGEGHARRISPPTLPRRSASAPLRCRNSASAQDKRRSKRLHRLIDTFTTTVDVVAFDSAAANAFGHVRAVLESKGKPIGILDTLIAAHALSRKLILVTNNTEHFAQIRGLKMENWLHDAG